MRHDTRVSNDGLSPGVCVLIPPRGSILFDEHAFNRMTQACGATTDDQRSVLVGVSSRTLARAKTGRFGLKFVGQVLLGLGRYRSVLQRQRLDPTFESLFEVVEVNSAEDVDRELVAA